EVYRDLINRYPKEESLRLNLATVFIRAGRLDDAEQELEKAIEIEPTHEKAHRTLAVVLMKKGEPERAHQHLAQAGIKDQVQTSQTVEEQDQPDNFVVQAQTDEPDGQSAGPDIGGFLGQEPVVDKADLPSARQPGPPRAAAQVSGPYKIENKTLTIRVAGNIYTRLIALVCVEGDLSYVQVRKRFGGQDTKYPFGTGPSALVAVDGDGDLLFSAEGQDTFVLRSLGQQSGYFVEDYIFAFGDCAGWENGRLQCGQNAEVPLFHIKGPGQIVLTCPGEVQQHSLNDIQKFLIRADKLIGWTGDLIPRLIEVEPPLPQGLWLELSGQGRIFYAV
ncbi:MAG: tetratricopeptide repeat protein, partial [Deltaproteobacteria bacterium]|nr:tetratricopeptide repeat protein [Deltaproteobacteria bacterium]